MDGFLEVDSIGNAEPPVKIEKVSAAAQENVLAVIEDFAGLGILKRAGPAAQRAAGFEKRDVQPGRFQHHRRGHAG
jgi:hypothetical protein